MASLNPTHGASTGLDRSSEASTSYKNNLPDKKTFIATLSGGAFVIGLTGATIYGLRKARLQALKEAQELAEAAKAGAGSSGNTSAVVMGSRCAVPSALSRPMAGNVGDAPSSLEEQGSGSTNALALFKQMNAAILNPAKRASGKVAPTSVFDDETGALPSVLRKRQQPTPSALAPNDHPHASTPTSTGMTSSSATATATLPSSTDPKIDYSEMDSTLDFLGLSTPVPAEEQRRLHELEQTAAADSAPRGFFDSPVGLSLKAFLIATSIVTISTLATVELTKWTLGVETMDEFVVAMTNVIPSRTRGEESLQGAAPHMRVVRDQTDLPTTSASASATPPKSVDQALTDLSNASSFEEWISTLKTQLDTERDFEVSRRFSNTLSHPNSNDSVSSSSSKPYTVHSPLEDLDSNHNDDDDSTLKRMLSISPVLPSTAFGLGLVSGVLTSGRKAGLVFMAENAHRLPDTVQGWYFYSKTKNYKVLLGAAKGGLKQGARLGVWTTGFCFAERMAELTRGAVQSQFAGGKGDGVRVVGHWTDGALAGVATAGAATALYRLPRASAVRVFQLGLLAGASTGGIRDLQERLLHREIGGVASHT